MTAPDGVPQKQPSETYPADRGLEPQVVQQLFTRYGMEVHRYLRARFGGDAQLAHDALQAALAKLLERGKEIEVEKQKAWLYQVAYREGLVILRRRQVDDGALRQLAQDKVSVAAAADEPLLQAEQVGAVKAALLSLSPEQRQVVQLRIYEQKTFAQIAEELQIPLGTALGRMRAAMDKLRSRLLPGEGVGEFGRD